MNRKWETLYSQGHVGHMCEAGSSLAGGRATGQPLTKAPPMAAKADADAGSVAAAGDAGAADADPGTVAPAGDAGSADADPNPVAAAGDVGLEDKVRVAIG